MRFEHDHWGSGSAASSWIQRPGVPSAARLGESMVVVGQRGTGKSHFLRAIADSARGAGVVTVRVAAGRVSSEHIFYSVDPQTAARRVLIDIAAVLASDLARALSEAASKGNRRFSGAEAALEILVDALVHPDVRAKVAERAESAEQSVTSSNTAKAQLELRAMSLNMERERKEASLSSNSSSISGEVMEHLNLDAIYSAVEGFIETGPFAGLCLQIDEVEMFSADVQQRVLGHLLRALPRERTSLLVAGRRLGTWMSSSEHLHTVADRTMAVDLASEFETLVDLDFAHTQIVRRGEGMSFARALIDSTKSPTLNEVFADPDEALQLISRAANCNPRRVMNLVHAAMSEVNTEPLNEIDVLAVVRRDHESARAMPLFSVTTERLARQLDLWALKTGRSLISAPAGSEFASELSFLADAGLIHIVPSSEPGELFFEIAIGAWISQGVLPPLTADLPTTMPMTTAELLEIQTTELESELEPGWS